MKVYNTEEKELIMEPVLKWAANPNITIAVKAFGLQATVQVVVISWSMQRMALIYSYCLKF